METSPLAERLWDEVRQTFQRSDAGQAPTRTFHRHLYAMMRCTLTIDADLAEDLAHGLFATPRRHEGWVRFSSAFFSSEWLPDAKGMAVKLIGVPGETCLSETAGEHDFVMVITPMV